MRFAVALVMKATLRHAADRMVDAALLRRATKTQAGGVSTMLTRMAFSSALLSG